MDEPAEYEVAKTRKIIYVTHSNSPQLCLLLPVPITSALHCWFQHLHTNAHEFLNIEGSCLEAPEFGLAMRVNV
jgi:hypothetical protein